MNDPVAQLTAAYEEEKRNRRPPQTADDLPFAYEDITPEWLTVTLCSKHPGAKVISCRLDVPDDGNSNRRRIFLDYNAAGQQAGLPERVFCKASQGLSNRISLGIGGAIQAEVNFYNQVRHLLDVEAPISYFAHFNSALNSIHERRSAPTPLTLPAPGPKDKCGFWPGFTANFSTARN